MTLVTREDNNGITTLYLNRPEKHNALSQDLIKSLQQQLDATAEDDDVQLVILAAQGKTFCAGADLGEMQTSIDHSEAKNREDAENLATLLNTLFYLPKPTIAKIQGSAFGGGVGIIACCDIAIAHADAQFCLSEVKLGLIPAVISPYLISAMGLRHLKRFALSTEIIHSKKALEIGLIHEMMPEENLESYIQQLAMHMINNGPKAMADCKKLLHHVQHHTIDVALQNYTAQAIAKQRLQPEAQARLQQFLHKS